MPHQRELLFLPPKSAPPTAVGSRGDSGFHRFSISSSSEGAGSTTEGRRRGGKGCRQAAPLPEREEVIVIRASTAAEWVRRFLSPAVLALAAGGGGSAPWPRGGREGSRGAITKSIPLGALAPTTASPRTTRSRVRIDRRLDWILPLCCSSAAFFPRLHPDPAVLRLVEGGARVWSCTPA
uniref:Uncharacterized protein n=1 Tax=Arundo donax TaxID=35708 RepID=A0A0A9BL84_ARUDO